MVAPHCVTKNLGRVLTSRMSHDLNLMNQVIQVPGFDPNAYETVSDFDQNRHSSIGVDI